MLNWFHLVDVDFMHVEVLDGKVLASFAHCLVGLLLENRPITAFVLGGAAIVAVIAVFGHHGVRTTAAAALEAQVVVEHSGHAYGRNVRS